MKNSISQCRKISTYFAFIVFDGKFALFIQKAYNLTHLVMSFEITDQETIFNKIA